MAAERAIAIFFRRGAREKKIERCNSIVMKAHSNALAQLASLSRPLYLITRRASPIPDWFSAKASEWVSAKEKSTRLTSSTFVFISFRLMENNVITKFEEDGPHDFEIYFALPPIFSSRG